MADRLAPRGPPLMADRVAPRAPPLMADRVAPRAQPLMADRVGRGQRVPTRASPLRQTDALPLGHTGRLENGLTQP